MPNTSPSDLKLLTTIAVLLLAVPVVRAERVCITTSSGTVCQDKLTSGTIAAIVLTILFVLTLLGGAVGFFLYRRKRLAAAKAAVAANAYVIDAAQLKGAHPITIAPAYAPKYDPHSAPHGVAGLPMKPASAGKASPQTAPTTYGGVTFPFQGYSSAKGTPPRSQSAFSGTYTTMNSSPLSSAGKGTTV